VAGGVSGTGSLRLLVWSLGGVSILVERGGGLHFRALRLIRVID